jgi:hypothetical protein
VYREPRRARPVRAEIQCRGRTVWVLFHNGVASSQESYVGVRSGDGGLSWRRLLAEAYFGISAPFQIDSYSGPWTLLDARAAVFVGTCPACGRGTVSLTVTLNGGRSFQRHRIPQLEGWEPRSVHFTDRRHGSVTARRGTLVRTVVTADGGRRWRVR